MRVAADAISVQQPTLHTCLIISDEPAPANSFTSDTVGNHFGSGFFTFTTAVPLLLSVLVFVVEVVVVSTVVAAALSRPRSCRLLYSRMI
jgi:hypothetical protein